MECEVYKEFHDEELFAINSFMGQDNNVENLETLSNGALCIYSLVWIAPKEGEVSAKSFFSALPSGIDVNSW